MQKLESLAESRVKRQGQNASKQRSRIGQLTFKAECVQSMLQCCQWAACTTIATAAGIMHVMHTSDIDMETPECVTHELAKHQSVCTLCVYNIRTDSWTCHMSKSTSSTQ